MRLLSGRRVGRASGLVGRLCVVVAAASVGAAACSASVPANIDDACAIFEEKGSWYKQARRARERWGVPISIQLAFIHQESAFRPKARPPRKRILWVIPGPRPSNAYGYAQVLDSTWDEYRRNGGNRGADRDDFGDAVDFIGWYVAMSSKTSGIRRDDAYSLYLAYHEGNGGYRRGTYKKKPWLGKVARKVSRRAAGYRAQLDKCEKRLRRRRFLFF